MWQDPPPEVTALRTMLVASSTWSTLAGANVTSSIHYPDFSAGDSASPDPLPLICIEPTSDGIDIAAPGILLPDGSLTVRLRMSESAASQATTIEKTARAIAYDVAAIQAGLPLIGVRVGMSSMPTPELRAGQSTSDEGSLGYTTATRDITIVFTYKVG
jgi:hypothetical protein